MKHTFYACAFPCRKVKAMNYGKRGVRAKQKALNSKAVKWERKFAVLFVKLLLSAFIGIGICGISAGIGAFRGILSSTPEISLNDVMATGEATIVYDREGNEIDQYVGMNSNRIQINSMDLIPEHLAHAFVAIEDERFYQHNGIDFEAIFRSAYYFAISLGKIQQGASTITQQLLKNTVFTTWTEENGNLIKTFKRKFQEQYLALEVTKHFSTGVYPVIITAIGTNNEYATKKIQAWVTDKNNVVDSSPTPQPAPAKPAQYTSSPNKPTSPKKKSKKKIVYIVLGVLVLLIAIIFGISACQAHNDTVQNEQAQSNALNNTNSKLDNLSEQNKQLMQQNKELQSAINTYKQDQNKEELQNQLNQIKTENEQLKNNAANNQALQNQIDQLGSTIDQIKQNPNQADSLLDQMKNNQNEFMQNLNATFQKLVSDFQQLIGQ